MDRHSLGQRSGGGGVSRVKVEEGQDPLSKTLDVLRVEPIAPSCSRRFALLVLRCLPLRVEGTPGILNVTLRRPHSL